MQYYQGIRKIKKYSKIQSKLHRVYDKNKDYLITIDEYLDKEISEGPLAKKGIIHYHYQNIDNFYNFFILMILNKKINDKVLCVPNFEVKTKNNVLRASIVIFLDLKMINIAPYLKDAIESCKYKKVRLIYIQLFILISNKNIGHVNVIIIDLKKNTIERFEPHGEKFYPDYMKKNQIDENNNYIDRTLINLFNKLELDDFKYINPYYISTKLGIQQVGDSYCGMCLTISMMYLHMRVLNLDIKQNKIVNHFLKLDKNVLKKKILKYAKYVEKTLKNNSNLVNKYNYELEEIFKKQFKNITF